jgi:Zn-dependent protease
MEIVILIVSLLLSLTLHEFAHALTGDLLGDETARREGRISLNPMAHIDPFLTLLLPVMLILLGSPVIFGAAKPVPFNPWAVRYGKWGAAMVAAAGPATNLLMVLVFGLWLRFMPVGELGAQFLGALVLVNAGFFVFNMIPFPPLDGSRVLYAAAPDGLRSVMDRIERSGLVGIFLLMFVAYPIIGPFVGGLVRGLVGWIVPELV